MTAETTLRCRRSPGATSIAEIPLDTREIIAVGDATRCGAQRRGFLFGYEGDHSRGRRRAVRAEGPRSSFAHLFE